MKTIIIIAALITTQTYADVNLNCRSADGKTTLNTDWIRKDGEQILKLTREGQSARYFSAHPLTLQSNLIFIPNVGDNIGTDFRLSLGRMNSLSSYPRSKVVATIYPHLGSDDRMTKIEELKFDLSCNIDGGIELNNVCSEEDESEYNNWLIEAAIIGDFDRVQQAISCGADVDSLNSSKCSSLMLAGLGDIADCGKPEPVFRDTSFWMKRSAIAKYLLDEGANANLQDERGETVAHKLLSSRMIELYKALSESGADLNKGDQYGMTPLMMAAINGNEKAIQVLVELGVDLKKKNVLGQTAYDLGEKLPKAVRSLLKADSSDGLVIQGSETGCGPLKLKLPMSTPTKFTLKSDGKSTFTMVQTKLGINLKAEPGKDASQVIKTDSMGTFKFQCGIEGGTQVTGQITITM